MFKRILLFCALLSFVLLGKAQKKSLDYYLDKAVQNSPLLKDYQNQQSASTIDSLLIRASQKYQTDFTSQISYAPVVKGWGFDEAITNGANIEGLVGVRKEVMNKNVLETRFHGLGIQKQSVGNSIKLAINDVKKSIINQYLTAYGDYNEITFNSGQLKMMNGQLAMLKQLVQNGVYKMTDYLSLLAETQTQELSITQLTGQYNSDILLLNQLSGIIDNQEVELTQPNIQELKTQDFSQSPLFMQFKIDSLRIENEKLLITYQFKPKLNWYANAGLITSTITDIYKHFGVSAGLNLIVPIYDGGQRKLETQKLSLSQNTRSNYQSFFKTQYQQQVYQIYRELANVEKILAQINKQLATSKDLIGIARSQLSNGTIPISDYLNSLRNQSFINRQINQTEVKRLLLINGLNYLKQQ